MCLPVVQGQARDNVGMSFVGDSERLITCCDRVLVPDMRRANVTTQFHLYDNDGYHLRSFYARFRHDGAGAFAGGVGIV